jgi:hypothetical protein
MNSYSYFNNGFDPNATLIIEKFSGNSVESLSVNPGTKGQVLNLSEYGGGTVVFEIDGSIPSIASSPRVGSNVPFLPLVNVELDNVRLLGRTPTSDYYIAYLIYNS